MATRWVTYWDIPGELIHRLDLQPGQAVLDRRATTVQNGMEEVHAIIEDRGQPLIADLIRDYQVVDDLVIGRPVARRTLGLEEAPYTKFYQLPPRNCIDPIQWVEFACMD